jgi:gamma-glutamylcysteine synthetase
METKTPIHKNDDDKWYFWDETWSNEIGPYDTQIEAEINFAKYVAYLNSTP